jgi:hypothetical protein
MQDKNKDGYGIMVAKKSERLVTALYIVTDLIDGSEPIKSSLRKNSVTLLSSMNALMQYDVKDRTTEFASALKSVMEIISLLHVASATGLVSEMNGSMLIDGFRVLQSVLEKRQPILTKEMISIDSEETIYEKAESYQGIPSTSYDALTLGEITRGIDKDAKETQMKKQDSGTLVSSYKGQSVSDYKGQENYRKTPTLPNVLIQHATKPSATLSSSFQTRKQSRREQIVSLFVKGVDVSIKDIAARIKGCSEKTIQRELNTLVYDNVIERIGEKRWSRYILK